MAQPNQRPIFYDSKPLCQIVGLACLTGFAIDVLVMIYPLQWGNLAWRVVFLQQLGDRSIILLFGIALLMYGVIDFKAWRKRLAIACLMFGVVFVLSGILVIRDGLALQEQALISINIQQKQIETQIDKVKDNPKLIPRVTPERLQQAAEIATSQAQSAKQSAQTGTLKTSVSGFGNLLVVGLALLGLGRYGIRPARC